MKRIIVVIILVFALILTISQSLYASSKYSGNYQYSTYGAKADIYTPSSAPYLGAPDGESSWVSTTASTNYWVQTGWFYTTSYSDAYSYIEYKIAGAGRTAVAYSTQNWNTYKNYEVYHDSSNYWNMLIDGSYYASVSDN